VTSFALAGSQTSTADSLTFSAGLVEGALLVAVLSERSGHGIADLSVADGNGGTWVAGPAVDNLVGNSSYRFSLASFWRRVTAADIAADTTPTVSASSESARLTVMQFIPDAPYAFELCPEALGAIQGSGSDHWNGLAVDTAAITGDDLFELALAGCRNDGGDLPSFATFSPQADGNTFHGAGTHGITHAHAHREFGQAGGIRSSALASNPYTGGPYVAEGILGLAVFRNAAAIDADPPAPPTGLSAIIL
jgi:hypothetical protein